MVLEGPSGTKILALEDVYDTLSFVVVNLVSEITSEKRWAYVHDWCSKNCLGKWHLQVGVTAGTPTYDGLPYYLVVSFEFEHDSRRFQKI